MASHSLRGRLLTLLLLGVVVAWSVTTLLAYQHAHHELDELLDAHLARAARLLVAQGGEELEEIRLEAMGDGGPYDQAIAFQLWRGGDRLVLRTPDAPAARLSPVDHGFSDAAADGREWRVFGAWDVERRLLVQVGEDHATRERLLRHYTLSSLPALLVGLPLLGLLVWVTVGVTLRPLWALGDEVGRRGPGDLEALPVDDAPREVVPLVGRLNALFARIQDSLLAERRFTSHAAHEMRTPIAAIRAQAEVARAATGHSQRDSALAHVIEGCDRAARLVDQMLLLARIDERAQSARPPAARLDRIAARVIAEQVPVALERDVSLELAGDEPVTVRADETLLEILLRNLVDNALRHGGAPGRVTVRCSHTPDGVLLLVTDVGPGVDPRERALLGQRFYRASGARGPGSGLGLSIVERIAERSGARVEYAIGPGGRGLAIAVRFPAAG